jgi:hypothetical protein
MMHEEKVDFYVTLFSHASQKQYPSNTLSAFTIQLARPIVLGSNDQWEFGLCEFTCVSPKKGRLL